MFKKSLFLLICVFLFEKTLRYYTFMGYSRHENVTEYEKGSCYQRFKNIKESEYETPIKSTFDADSLVNGLSIFVNGNQHPYLPYKNDKADTNHIFLLDINQINNWRPLRLKIYNKKKQEILSDSFNLFTVSLYHDHNGNLKLLASNFLTKELKLQRNREDVQFTIEKFQLDQHRLIHVDTFYEGLDTGQLCDLIVIDEYLFYFTKCFSDSSLTDFKFGMSFKSGEIWAFDLRKNIVYPVAKGIFYPTSIGFIKSKNIIVVSNLDVDGISLYQREFDNSLTKIQDVNLNNCVLNIFVDFKENIWLTTQPVFFRMFNITAEDDIRTSSELLKLKLDFNAKKSKIYDFEIERIFSSNGDLLNGLSSSIAFKDYYILFSFKNDPRVCYVKENK